MGLIERLKRITLGRIEAFLDSVESPETVLPALVEELAARIRQAGNAEAKALTAVRSAQRRLDETAGRAGRLGRGAELAVQAGDMDTARQALAAQIDAERQLAQCRQWLDTAEQSYRQARAVRVQLQEDLAQLKQRKAELLARSRAARAQKRALAKLAVPDAGGILEAVARMEAKVEQAQAEAEVRSEVARALGAGFEHERTPQLEQDEQVEQRLRQLKQRAGQTPS